MKLVRISHWSDSDENAIDCEIACDCVRRANVVVGLRKEILDWGRPTETAPRGQIQVNLCMCVCVGVCFSMLWIRGSSPLPVFLVLAPELVSVSIANTPEGLLKGHIVFPSNLTHDVKVILYTALDGEIEYKEIETVTVSPKSGSLDLSKMATEPLRLDHGYRLRIEEMAGARRVLFDKLFTPVDGKLGFGKLWKKCATTVLINAENPASQQPSPVRYMLCVRWEKDR